MGSTPHLMLFQAGTVIPTGSRMHGRCRLGCSSSEDGGLVPIPRAAPGGQSWVELSTWRIDDCRCGRCRLGGRERERSSREYRADTPACGRSRRGAPMQVDPQHNVSDLLDPPVANKLPGGRGLEAWHSLLQAHATLMRQLAMDLERETGLALADFDVLAQLSVAG